MPTYIIVIRSTADARARELVVRTERHRIASHRIVATTLGRGLTDACFWVPLRQLRDKRANPFTSFPVVAHNATHGR